ncbi:Thiopurine S-methyltransferase [compost metagenome]|uniref:thiopurine S-methyltransferase n=1 Tax=unclassified Pseudomonas TaxID=196821 RepID=UPI0005EBAEFC|nr:MULTISPECIES: thiopurine S-methyltransferase [unclassified Pseudomonas]KJK06417.1 thiopurine S-methyltransferase [Pseudomonas sp. 5]QYX47771.1 thiopurine S-methyltransferase [Pseudomonas sp. S11A 273]
MQAEFWHSRWASNQIGFHQPQVNSYLQQYWPTLAVSAGERVLVPLCGKSLDMLWLAGQGLQVLGVELSERAVEDFFNEHQLQPQVEQCGAFKVYRCEGIEIRCGDFFALTAEDVSGCTALYDRAAVIALPAAMRKRYVAHLQAILAPAAKGLLITLDYDQSKIDGPPFAVTDQEVQVLFAAWHPLAQAAHDVLAESPKFQQAGASHLFERVYRLQR